MSTRNRLPNPSASKRLHIPEVNVGAVALCKQILELHQSLHIPIKILCERAGGRRDRRRIQ
jgi:hypothetical protein